mmetsp:Transcript_23285/g.42088  ORF Transcript_23285/g.42088 Transcript_23285/m.42088 type:complete len:404 (-) Transcript_23285:76-1287(-)|eukprot:CAMPEP_0197628350 /NCGR_PEP_ID=MMETSP1338-20131121/6694_1 /TAXON_ID=43686 ORGANISM="Pelagodinium beii, Strain RCC1491" /NCGR_SAMPLE_ID=MMETSP1338 /ASSEMBLY_ACC=CAM_ASM_000754 /LENGTH=403 /DNA_ID=CAMNT_0043199311 /DNA_START=37 /DNA_END=1248 /DNA_ORIENTATION=-
MQPLVYLAVRVWLGWVQFIERSERAFINSPLVLVAAGSVHSWAVVYSLFVAVHTRAMRFSGYHQGNTENLPGSVAVTETLAVASLWVWLIAGFTTAACRMLDEDADGLPMGDKDLNVGPFLKFIRSPQLHNVLAHAHSVSCAGLFVSVMLLCMTMAVMSGGITVCETCLVLVAICFAAPHAVLAVRRLSDSLDIALGEILPMDTFEAAAAEAAAVGPQLSVLLSLADAPGHAFWWQNIAYTVAAMAFVAAVVACGLNPQKLANTAVPPDPEETFVCLLLNSMTALAIVLSYPHLNTWFLKLSVVAVIAITGASKQKELREIYLDWLEPVFQTPSDSHKGFQNLQRQTLRKIAWGATLFCAVVTLWDIMAHTQAVAVGGSPVDPATTTADAAAATEAAFNVLDS